MIFQKQAFRHRPDEGVFGDCHRTAIACMLNLPRDKVPNFGEHWGDPEGFEEAVRAFLRERELAAVNVVFAAPLADVLQTMGAVNPAAYYLLGGTSTTGVGHTVVGHGGRIVLDPSLDDAGIVGPMDDGYFWITFLVPLCTVERIV
jgi:hypothetical protein